MSVQAHRAHVLNLCYAVEESCSLTDINALKGVARMILQEMGEPIKEEPVIRKENFDDLF